ncbi:hypothetical protein BKA01_002811 [Pseudonocardia eucalypti]|nr:hypothetical protein [Pseudonocardia eucalypti]
MNYGKYILVRVDEAPGGVWRSRTLLPYQRGLTLHEIHRLLSKHTTSDDGRDDRR